MSAFAAAAALGYTGAEGKTTACFFRHWHSPRSRAWSNRERRLERSGAEAAPALGADCMLAIAGGCWLCFQPRRYGTVRKHIE